MSQARKEYIVGIVGLDKSMSLDGYIMGPNPGKDNPLGDGGDRVFAWMMAGPAENEAAGDQQMLNDAWDEMYRDPFESTGAVIMGKRMFEIIDGPDGWVAPDGTAFTWPVFVLTHEVREPVTKGKTAFTFVNDGIESAPALARARPLATGTLAWEARTSPSSSSALACWTRSVFTSCRSSWVVASVSSITLESRHGISNSREESRSPASPISSFDSRKPRQQPRPRTAKRRGYRKWPVVILTSWTGQPCAVVAVIVLVMDARLHQRRVPIARKNYETASTSTRPSFARGIPRRNAAPAPSVLSTVSVPPWRSAITRAIGSLSPEPGVVRDDSARKKRSKMRSRISGGIPGPSSITRTSTASSLT